MKKAIRWALATFMLAFAPTSMAQNTLTYQGEVLNAARAPVTASYPMAFALYTDRDGGPALWTEAYESVDVLDGSFTVNLGSVTPFPQHLGAEASLYLGVAVNGAPEMRPRVKVSAALRADWAAHAKDVRGEDIHPRTVSIGDREVINSDGQWVGDPSGLRGEPGAEGPPGPSGEEGPSGMPGPIGPGFDPTQDTDMDGFNDWIEIMVGTEPSDDSSVPFDADGDGLPDALVGPPGIQGDDGTPGVSIDDARINENGQLQLFMTDGRLLTVSGSIQGSPGIQGVAGPAGTPGVIGPAGPPGLASLIRSAVESPGAHCPAGGVRIEHGVDADGNEVLDAMEVSGVHYVCNPEQPVSGAGGTLIHTRCPWVGQHGKDVGSCEPPACPNAWQDLGLSGNVMVQSLATGATGGIANTSYTTTYGYAERACYREQGMNVLQVKCNWIGNHGKDIRDCTPSDCPVGWLDLGELSHVLAGGEATGSTGGIANTSYTMTHGYVARVCVR